MKIPYSMLVLVFILGSISKPSSASVFSDSTLTCGGKNVTISIPQSYVTGSLDLKTGDSLRVAADNECRTERVESPSNETHCRLEKVGSNYEATFPNADCDVIEKKMADGLFSYSYTIVKSTSSSVRRYKCQDVTFTCLVYTTNDTVTGDSYNITDVEQTGQREQTQQVELRGGFLNEMIVFPSNFNVFKNSPVLTINSSYNFYIFFAPNNSSSDVWTYDGNGNLPTDNSTLYLGTCDISNPDDATEIVQITDDNGCATQEAEDSGMMLSVNGMSDYIVISFNPFAWSSGVHTSQVLTCQVRLCTSGCPAPYTCTSRAKRDLGDVEGMKTFEISTDWETTTDRDNSCAEDNGGCESDEYCHIFDDEVQCSKVIKQTREASSVN